MEAKDRIVKTNEYNCHNTLEERLAEQDKISFKAGREEVVGWVNKECYWHNMYNKHSPDFQDGYEFTVEEWQAKLKEWGIK